jgi:hypothetical protein
MRIAGEVKEARCSRCGTALAAFIFSGDTDMVTTGLAAVSAGSRHLVLGELQSNELSADGVGEEAFARRAGGELGLECRSIRVKRYEGGAAPPGVSFAEFRAAYRPSQPVYACGVCDGDAIIVATSNPAEFVASGGVIDLLGNVVLADDL